MISLHGRKPSTAPEINRYLAPLKSDSGHQRRYLRLRRLLANLLVYLPGE
jgi:hypothetical protein